jgi:hypothetical protein
LNCNRGPLRGQRRPSAGGSRKNTQPLRVAAFTRGEVRIRSSKRVGGQVQMIHMDPPYGVKFGSNFQPFVRKRNVKHNDDDNMTFEPEMVRAYRDTWELGLHSHLSYMRDRLLLSRELLVNSGSIFVQINMVGRNSQHN